MQVWLAPHWSQATLVYEGVEALHEHRPTAASKAADDDAVRELLRDRAGEFAKLLTGLGPDRDLADKADPLVHDDWPGWRLMTELRSIRGVGVTIGTKLLARKRPRLRPIWDDIVAELIQARPGCGSHCACTYEPTSAHCTTAYCVYDETPDYQKPSAQNESSTSSPA